MRLTIRRALIVAALLTFPCMAVGQPAPLKLIDPFDTCDSAYRVERDGWFIFVGEVLEYPNEGQYRKVSFAAPMLGLRLRVETSIKGSLSGEIVINITNYGRNNRPEIGKKYILTGLRGWPDPTNSRIGSYMWSFEVQELPDELLSRIVEKIRDVSLGKRQAQIEGVLLGSEYSPNGITRYSSAPQVYRLFYDRTYSSVLPNTEIEIVSETNERFVTKSDNTGWFTFEGIPAGKYRIRPMISHPFNMSLNTYLYPPRFEVEVEEFGKWKCGTKALIGVTYVGKLEVEVDLNGRGIATRPGATLYPVNSATGKVLRSYPLVVKNIEYDARDNKVKLRGDDIPVGEYIVLIYNAKTSFYFPDSNGVTATKTIKVGR